MTLPLYPSELPAPLRTPYSVARGDGRLIGRNDAGPRNVRRRFAATVKTISFSTLLSRSQLARFDRFYYEETKEGALPFLIPDPRTDSWPLLTDEGEPLLTDDDTPILLSEIMLVIFGDRLPDDKFNDLEFNVAFDLQVLP